MAGTEAASFFLARNANHHGWERLISADPVNRAMGRQRRSFLLRNNTEISPFPRKMIGTKTATGNAFKEISENFAQRNGRG